MRPFIPTIISAESSWYGADSGDDSDDGVVQNVHATEETPLLATAPTNSHQRHESNKAMLIVVGLLLAILFVGSAIGVYLLVLQSDEEHILPPVKDMPIRRVNGSEWDESDMLVLPADPFYAETVIIEQSDTRECEELETCVLLLRELKESLGVNGSLPHNFLLSSDGTAYEGLGWSKLSPLYPELSPFVIMFLGNFVHIPPPIEQVNMAKSLISVSLKRGFLVQDYRAVGKLTKQTPRYLFEKFKDFPQWKVE